MLNPGGMVSIDGERLHAFSEGVIIEPEEWVEVLEVRGARVLVRRSSAPAAANAAPDDDLAQADDGDDPNPPAPLDFDLPRG
jgi:membrane-bound serine protease (ClpP class)